MKNMQKDPSEPSGYAIPEVAWKRNSRLIQDYLEQSEEYGQVGVEIAYALKRELRRSGIEFASITHRVKTLSSLVEKLKRKGYSSSLDEISDLSGVRVVCLYAKDVALVNQIIRSKFIVLEFSDKKSMYSENQFGYLSQHSIVTLGKKFTGSRYDGLKSLRCEIQVRTLLQDTWAVIYHHLVYKRESAIPPYMKRQLGQLAASFELADNAYQGIKEAHDNLPIKGERARKAKVKARVEPISLQSVRNFLLARFPGLRLEPSSNPGQFEQIFSSIDSSRYRDVGDLENAFKKHKAKLSAAQDDLGDALNLPRNPKLWSSSSLLLITLFLDSDHETANFFPNMAPEWVATLDAVKHTR